MLEDSKYSIVEEKANDDEDKDDTNKPNSQTNIPKNRSRLTPQETQDDDLVQNTRRQATSTETIPSSQTMEQNQPQPLEITPNDIEKVLSSAWVNKKLCYKVKLKNMSKNEWVHKEKVPQNMRRDFHESRTQSGKIRKRPLHQNKHRFFGQTDQTHKVTKSLMKSSLQKDQSCSEKKFQFNLLI